MTLLDLMTLKLKEIFEVKKEVVKSRAGMWESLDNGG